MSERECVACGQPGATVQQFRVTAPGACWHEMATDCVAALKVALADAALAMEEGMRAVEREQAIASACAREVVRLTGSER